jgi:hypothetical protein
VSNKFLNSGMTSQITAAFADTQFDVLVVDKLEKKEGFSQLPVRSCDYLRRCFLDMYSRAAYEKSRILAEYGKDGELEFVQMPVAAPR